MASYRWVSVRIRLPEVNRPIMIYTSQRRMLFSWVDEGTKQIDDNELNESEFVTHWRDKPPPPKNP